MHIRFPPLAVAALMLAALPVCAQDAPGAALKACPTIQHEIVDLGKLSDALAQSGAVGMFEKLRLKSAIDQLIGRMKDYHRGTRHYSLAQLQEQYDLLMMRIAQQLQDKDPALHGRLCNAWQSLWAQLRDRDRFMEKFS